MDMVENASGYGDTIHERIYGKKNPISEEIEESEQEIRKEISASQSIADMENALANLKRLQLEKVG